MHIKYSFPDAEHITCFDKANAGQPDRKHHVRVTGKHYEFSFKLLIVK